MAYSIELREKAIRLRKIGNSLNEIHGKLKVSKSTLSEWLRDVQLSESARKRLLTKIKIGQLISAENKKSKSKKILDEYRLSALREIRANNFNHITVKVICALMYWCEGAKDYSYGVGFTNSDPRLVCTFLYLLRRSFSIDEKKFRPCVHLHQYHNQRKQIQFWSQATNIPEEQFIKLFLKKNTGKRVRKNYQGCIAIRYHNADTAKQLLMTAEAFMSQHGGMV
jgi:transcriptional regulator with XRE-family HTH domain